jgi:hypothetical protein
MGSGRFRYHEATMELLQRLFDRVRIFTVSYAEDRYHRNVTVQYGELRAVVSVYSTGTVCVS